MSPRWDRGAEPLPMCAVLATEAGTGDGGDLLHWLLLTTERPAECEAAAMHAATVLDWYRCQCQSKIPHFLAGDELFHSSVSISFP